MADLSDVTAYLAQQAAAAVYPNGTGSPSVAAMDCRIYEGWPIPDQLDLDMQGKMLSGTPPATVVRPNGPVANVSIYPMQGTGATVYQILDKVYTITAPAIDCVLAVSGEAVTLTGTPGSGEYLTLVIDDAVICSQTGATAVAILSALAAQAQAAGYAATVNGNTLTVPFGHSLVVRQGGVATLGKVTHRQKHAVMVTVWAPTRVARNQLAAAVDNLIKQNIKVAMPDTSDALVIYNRTMFNDEQQAEGIYRRDLIYDVEYATVQEFPGYVITSVQTSIAAPNNAAIATAIT